MFTVYVLCSTTTGKLYIGQTENLDKRLYTRGRGPLGVGVLREATD